MKADFFIDKDKVRQAFSLSSTHYDELALLQKKVGQDLLNKFAIESTNNILDVGCGTGFLTYDLLEKKVGQQLIALDLASSMLQMSKNKLKRFSSVQYICADAEQLPLLKNSIDTLVSNLALQWCQNLSQVFNGFNDVLKKGGQVYFSTFGSATLQELKYSWKIVDDYSHVNEFYTTDQLYIFLQQSGFKEIYIDTKMYYSNYRTVIDLMRELKGIGAHNVLSGRNRKLTSKGQMQKMINAYEKFRTNGMIPATYEIIFVSATK